MPSLVNPRGKKRKRKGEGDPSYLVKETSTMERKRRLLEQKGLRALLQAKVHEREHDLDNPQTASLMNESFGDGLEKHPLLESQLFDGIDNNPSDPYLDPESKRKVENKRREQKLEKQLRYEKRLELTDQLQYTPKFNPKPGGP